MEDSVFARSPRRCDRRPRREGLPVALAALLFSLPSTLAASPIPQQAPQEQPDSARADTLRPILLDPINVTATREAKGIFETAAPVSVVDSALVREVKPNNAAELVQSLPGIDVNGVGANQQRPTIRGQRGQRILLLENGLRLNNARRDQDFGELPAIVDVNKVERVEVVRGPASVLYGSDALGGVVNMITNEAPPYAGGDDLRGNVGISYRDQGEQLWPSGELWGRSGRLGYGFSASYRDTKDYEAPAGSFGDITLDDDVTVRETGVEDQNYGVWLDYALGESQKIWGAFDSYQANDAGFGYVANDALPPPPDGSDPVDISLRYPSQKVNRFSAGYRGVELGLPVADRITVSAFYLDNERTFNQDIFIPIATAAPGTGITFERENYTDLASYGVRAEASRLLAARHRLTYGLDWYHDDSENTDFTRNTFNFGGPPQVSESEIPSVPNATYDRLGAFAQIDLQVVDRVALIVGGRYQNDRATPQETPNFENPLPAQVKNDQVVGAANLLVEILPSLNFVGTAGRGFRSPNLIELFYDDFTPDGSGYQRPNPDLQPETSWNFDLGLKYRRSNVAFEGYYFRNEISDGISISDTGESIGPSERPIPVYENVNIDRATIQGIELMAEYVPVTGLTLGATYTWLDGEYEDAATDEVRPYGNTYSSRITADVAYRRPSGRWWASYRVRHNGAQRNAEDLVTGSLLGDEIPAFTTMSVRGGVRVIEVGRTRHELVVGVENLTNELYAEFSNASFFRPNPKRTFLVSWVTSF